ncbi:MAG: EFR1 family ferrodoxin [Tannerellaceae bacterium]|nr:EFR1 family ferrodoxin [Tannerellaceae bacterium]
MKKDKEITIYYFSATGNSLKLAVELASHFTASTLLRIDGQVKVEPSTSEIVGFIFPVYMGTLPKVIHNFLQDFPFKKNVYYFSVATYYLYKGCTIPVVGKIMQEKGISLNYGNYLPTVGNCLMKYEVSADKRIHILDREKEITTLLINDIKNEVEKAPASYSWLSEKIYTKLFNAFFGTVSTKFSLENSCISCGSCQKICPVNNISIHNGQPVWGSKCVACHACVHWCPKNAINLGSSKGRLQYHNPAITRTMMLEEKEYSNKTMRTLKSVPQS